MKFTAYVTYNPIDLERGLHDFLNFFRGKSKLSL